MFSNLNYDSSNILDLRNLLEQVKKAFCLKNWFDLSLFEYLNCSSDLKFCNFSSFSLAFQKFFSIKRTFFLTVGQNFFWDKTLIFYGKNTWRSSNRLRWTFNSKSSFWSSLTKLSISFMILSSETSSLGVKRSVACKPGR